MSQECLLCKKIDEELIWENDDLRVILVHEPSLPGFCRVIWNRHVVEMTDLVPEQRSLLMRTVCLVESVIRQVMQPHKMNLAALGNRVPHIHWHVIPRFEDDVYFPDSVWSAKQREPNTELIAQRQQQLCTLRVALRQVLEQVS